MAEANSSEATGDAFGLDVGPKSESLTGGELPESESTDHLHASVLLLLLVHGE